MSPEALPSMSVTRQKRILGWLTSMRLSNSPTVVSNVLVGAALAGVLQPDHPSVVMLAVAMVLYYTAGMILNHVGDFTWDKVHRPSRPMPAGLLRRAGTVAVVVLFACSGTVLLWYAGRPK